MNLLTLDRSWESRAGLPAGSADVQPHDGSRIAQEGLDAEERLERLLADRELLTRLMLNQYTGPEWNRFWNELARYGFSIWLAWTLGGRAFVESAKIGHRVRRSPRMRADDAREIALETVARGLKRFFNHTLRLQKWDYTKGASLRTYFVGACKYEFANALRRWETETGSRRRPFEHTDIEHPSTDADPETAAFAREAETLVGPKDREWIQKLTEGCSKPEIASELGTTTDAIKHRIARQQARMAEKAMVIPRRF